MPGSSPSGSRVIRRWGRSQRPGKNLFNYKYRGRLETDSVVGELVEKRGCRWEFSQENGEGERNDMGESAFPETDPIPLLFTFVYIPFCYT